MCTLRKQGEVDNECQARICPPYGVADNENDSEGDREQPKREVHHMIGDVKNLGQHSFEVPHVRLS